MNTLEEVIKLIARVLEVEVSELNGDTGIGDLPTWDSLHQVQIIVELEQLFNIQFSQEVIREMEDINDIVAAVEERLQ
jgi:acyl carrier protein